MEERHMAALLVERSFIDLRSQVTVNGVCNILASDVKYMISDNCRAKVWSAGYQSFALWYVSLWIYTFESLVFHRCIGKFIFQELIFLSRKLYKDVYLNFYLSNYCFDLFRMVQNLFCRVICTFFCPIHILFITSTVLLLSCFCKITAECVYLMHLYKI